MEEVLQARESYNKRQMPYDYEPTVAITPITIEGVNCYWFTPEDPSPNNIIVFLHGGGFAMGSVRTHGMMVSHFAKKLQSKILFVEYALAPEHPFPAGLNDVVTVYRQLIDRFPGYQINLIGDSAGGSLIVSAVGEMLKAHLALPHAVVLICPWISMEYEHASVEENAHLDISLNREALHMFARAYTGSMPIEVSSPNKALRTQFPPVLIMVGTNEILLDDSRHFYNEIKSIQKKAKLSIYNEQPHVWLKKDIHQEASRRALAEIADFLSQH